MKNFALEIIVEIPKNSSNKYEYDFLTNSIKLDRVLYGSNFYPGEYGSIAETLDYDGDPLDAIILSTYPTFPGCYLKARIVGVLKMEDDGEIDHKLVGVVFDDPRFNDIQSWSSFPNHEQKVISEFFATYKNLQNKQVIVKGFADAEAAHKVLKECQNLYLQFKHYLQSGETKQVKSQLLALQKSKVNT